MASNVSTSISTQMVKADGVQVATRSCGSGSPLVLLNRFRGTMDNWDPALLMSLARQRRVIAFDSMGIGESTGDTPPSVERMADFAAAIVRTLDVGPADILGWSIGGFVAQVFALKTPDLVRKLVLAATSAPAGVPEVTWSPTWLETASHPRPSVETAMSLFYTDTPSSRAAGGASFARMPSPPASFVSPAAMAAQAEALTSYARNEDGWYSRLKQIKASTFVANGDRDGLFPAIGSAVLAREIPNSRLAIYPDSGHGFLFQYAERFSGDVLQFLSEM
jgi:pimeloyl-ACP methyl ester carboxylesterase